MLKSRSEELPPELQSWVEERRSTALTYQTETADVEDVESVDVPHIGDQQWRLHVLYAADDLAEQEVVGALVLRSPVTDVPLDVKRAIAAQLQSGYSRAAG